MEKIDIEKRFYRPICSSDEIERIFKIESASDYLLKLRADTIVDNMRLFRVYRNKAIEEGENWCLEDSFNKSHYENFRRSLSPDLTMECDKITFGDIFSTETNGLIFPTDYGIITTISESIKYFLFFMNLGLLDFSKKIPEYVRFNSMRIAIRIMLQTEALDFKMDPRGIIPPSIEKRINDLIPFQLQFLAGHEYAHFLLGHLNTQNLTEKFLLKSAFKSQTDYKKIGVYNISQKHEFDADISSINIPNYIEKERISVYESALFWFAALSIYEAVEDYLFPPNGHQSHPSAISRYLNLLDKIPKYKGFNKKYYEEDIPSVILKIRDEFIDNVGYHCDDYEMYGSTYLDKPNTEWRGRKLIDRVDYY
ncbi:MAG TPA: hypothetical protein PKC55_17800 [Dysgonomonas sp.]|uniref:hypothetical protein n=1 Tax=unclassified Dysgonomonas TaxID=2630389 RepID=UPI0025C61F7D|nr:MULTISPECIES: hypothetical protein [unclassified Dysgonomonas]HML66683.1 hypothetical protein [Dysgonomonas sp.]